MKTTTQKLEDIIKYLKETNKSVEDLEKNLPKINDVQKEKLLETLLTAKDASTGLPYFNEDWININLK